MDAVVQLDGVTVIYGKNQALKNVSATFAKGAVGLLGPNGAGKSTMLKSLLGFVAPNRGRMTGLGLDVAQAPLAIRARIGYMPESDAHIPGMNAVSFVAYCGELSGLPPADAMQRAHEVLFYVGLGEARYRNVETYSTGMKQRIKLAQAIVHDPDLVFLDEPTNGMDPQGRDEMLDLIARIHNSLGIAVVISSHILEDIERVCDYVVILSQGRMILDEPMSAIGSGATELRIRVEGDSAPFRAALERAGLPATLSTAEDDMLVGEFYVPMRDEGIYDVIRDVAVDLGASIRSLRPRARTLEDVYLGNVAAAETEKETADATSR